jgi:glycerol-3-phosphate acyltransferase PlsY
LAIAVILGHIYPVFFGFRGGKGAATLIGALLGAAPLIVLYLLAVWLLVVMLSGFVGLATMVATLSLLLIPQLPPTLGLTLPWSELGTAVIGMIIVYAHRGNIWRMIQGTENRAKKLWIFKSKQS